MISKLRRLVLMASAPILDLAGVLRGWFLRSGSLRYFLVSADYPGYMRHGAAMAFCLEHAKRWCHGQGVDVGAGRWPFPGARAVENNPDENAFRLREDDRSLDFVFSAHCLEHLKAWQDALKEWRRVLKTGGILYLYLPHPASSMWNPAVLPYHAWQPHPDPLAYHLRENGFEVVEHSVFPDAYLSFYVVARRIDPAG